jgi:hypothetical protein
MNYRFTHTDIGCYAHGNFGHQHVRDTLALMVSDITECEDELFWELTRKPRNGFKDENEAIKILQTHTSPELMWLIHQGDLVLMGEDEWRDV